MTEPQLSVVIPTYNRLAVLQQALAALERQSFPPAQFEVIVVDDGSTDGTWQSVSRMTFSFSHVVLQQQNRGAAAARNLGAARARADILLFLDSDIIAAPQLVREHIQSHMTHRGALVVGHRAAWPEARKSCFSRVIDWDTNVRDGGRITFQEAFSANLSIRRSDFFALAGFNEHFPASGCEDVDFAYRATCSGLEIVYNPAALGYHNHPIDLPGACRQAYSYQISAALLFRQHPELRGRVAHLRDKEPVAWRDDAPGLLARKLARHFLALRPVLALMEWLVAWLERVYPRPGALRFFYWKILGGYQLMGLREGLRRYGDTYRCGPGAANGG